MGILEVFAPYPLLNNLNGTFPERLLPDNLIPSPADRIPVTQHVMLTQFVPVLFLFYILGVLVQLPNTRSMRLSILPVMGILAWRIATRYNFDESDEPGSNLTSMTVCWFMSFLMLRATDFATSKKLFKRERFSLIPADAPKDSATQLKGAALNAFDLMLNGRGIGWNWGKGIYVPPAPTRSTGPVTPNGPIDFLVGYVKTQVFFDFVLFAQQSWDLSPSKYPTHRHGGSIFNPDLPPLPRYGKVVSLTFLRALTLYTSFQATYYGVGFVAMAVFGQVGEQWPLLFQAPWEMTSLGDFWGVRWHQVFKRVFIICGAKPTARLFGRTGGVLGAFFVSGLMHDFAVWGAGTGTELSSVTLFFFMMGVGCILEVVWLKRTGFKVGGPLGWLWSMAWLLFWGSWIVDAWARRGLITAKSPGDNTRPAVYWVKVVQRWVELNGQPFQ